MKKAMAETDQELSEQETAKRRDEAVKRALSMPPKHKKAKKPKAGKKKAPVR